METECQREAKETTLNATEMGTFLSATVHEPCIKCTHITSSLSLQRVFILSTHTLTGVQVKP